MPGERVEAAFEVIEPPLRAWLAMHGDTCHRAGGPLPGLAQGRKGRVIAPLALPAFADSSKLACALQIARAIVAAAGACRRARRLDHGAVFADHDRVTNAGEILPARDDP